MSETVSLSRYLKMKKVEAGVTEDEVAARIGWSKQNLNYKLNHENVRFASMLLIAEGIGLACKVTAPDGSEQPEGPGLIEQACDLKISSEQFEQILKPLGYRLSFDWRKSGDRIYTLGKDKEGKE